MRGQLQVWDCIYHVPMGVEVVDSQTRSPRNNAHLSLHIVKRILLGGPQNETRATCHKCDGGLLVRASFSFPPQSTGTLQSPRHLVPLCGSPNATMAKGLAYDRAKRIYMDGLNFIMISYNVSDNATESLSHPAFPTDKVYMIHVLRRSVDPNWGTAAWGTDQILGDAF